MITSQKTILNGSPDDLRRKVEALALDQEPHVYQAGTRFRELAVTLAMQAGLRVSVISYEDGSQELEVVLTDHPSCDPIVIGRDQHGGRCQLSWDLWLPIEDQPGFETVVNLIQAALNATRPAPVPAPATITEHPVMRREGTETEIIARWITGVPGRPGYRDET